MKQSLLDLRRLIVLREVAREGTIAAAAVSMAYSSSAISQQLAKLQKDLGVELLEHVGRNVALTPAALMLVDRLDDLLGQIEQIETDLSGLEPNAYVRLQIGAFQSFTGMFAADLLRAMQQRLPNLDVSFRQVEPAEATADLIARELDLAVIDEFPSMPAPRPPRTHMELLAEETLIPYFPEGVSVALRADLSRLSWVSEPKGTPTYELLVRSCRKLGFEPTIKYETTDFESHRRLVEGGAAAAFLPEMFLTAPLNHLERIPGFTEPLIRRIYTVVREGTESRPSIKFVRELMREQLAHLGGDQSKANRV